MGRGRSWWEGRVGGSLVMGWACDSLWTVQLLSKPQLCRSTSSWPRAVGSFHPQPLPCILAVLPAPCPLSWSSPSQLSRFCSKFPPLSFLFRQTNPFLFKKFYGCSISIHLSTSWLCLLLLLSHLFIYIWFFPAGL